MPQMDGDLLKSIFRWILVSLTTIEVIWIYSSIIFMVLNIITVQMNPKAWPNVTDQEMRDMCWLAVHLTCALVLRIVTAYYAFFKAHMPSFILIWSYDVVILLLTLILLPPVSANTGVLLLTRFTLELLLSLFLVFLNVSRLTRDEDIPAIVVRRLFVQQL